MCQNCGVSTENDRKAFLGRYISDLENHLQKTPNDPELRAEADRARRLLSELESEEARAWS